MTGKITEQQFQDLLHMITCVAELEARKAYSDLVDTDTETEQTVAEAAIKAADESLVQKQAEVPHDGSYRSRLKVCQQHLKDARNEIDRLRAANSMCQRYHETLRKVAEGLELAPGEDVTVNILPRLYKLKDRNQSLTNTIERSIHTNEALAEERNKLAETVAALRTALRNLGE